VDVPYELQQIRLLFHEDGLVPVLEEVARPLVAPIEGPGVSREEPSHGRRQGPFPCPDQEMNVIGQEGPGDDRETSLGSDGREAVGPILPIGVIGEDGSSFDSPHHDMV
jgi:hypothetical protein